MEMVLTKICKHCGKLFEKPYSCSLNAWNNRKKFCSKICKYLFQENKHTWNFGKKMGAMPEAQRIKISNANKGTKTWNTGLTKETDPKVKEMSKKIAANGSHFFEAGEKHPAWKGGTSPERARCMCGKEYKQWRLDVYKKDGYTCQLCKKTGKKLHAHHLQPYAEHPQLRTCVDNGVTLCKDCHRIVHFKTNPIRNAAMVRAMPDINNIIQDVAAQQFIIL
jgi:hypothetical protein